jgi:dTDP-glucose 4,6-dehydratase
MTQHYNPKKILVTGAAGFIGCNFVRYMLEKHPELHIISYDKLTYAGSLDNLADLPNEKNHTFIKGDICDRELVDKVLRAHHIDTIVHFAAESHVDRSITGPTEFIQTNIVGTFTLLESARQFWLEEKKWNNTQCRFHHISTDEVYGTLGPNVPPFTETTPYAPNSPYSASKASSDHLVRAYFHTYKLPTTLTNCSNNYGPYQNPEKFIPTVIRSCKEWKNIPVYGDGSNIRDWLHVSDHCSAIDVVIHQGVIGESYNVGGDAEKSNLDVVDTICDLMDKHYPREKSYKTLITFVEDRKGHDWRYAIDGHKLMKELRWKPKAKFLNGMKELILEETKQ